MIEKKIQDKVEDTVVAALEQDIVHSTQPGVIDPVDPVLTDNGVPLQEDPAFDPLAPAEQPEVPKPEDQVAGLGGVVSNALEAMAKRTAEAEKRVVSPLAPDPIQKVGSTLLVREADQATIDALNEGLGGDYIKSLNLPNIAAAGGEMDLATFLDSLKQSNKELFEQARRGTLNIEALTQLASQMDMQRVIYDWTQRAPGDAASAEDLLAGIIGLKASIDQTREAVRGFQAMPAGPERDAAVQKAGQMVTLVSHLAANTAGSSSEAGRALYVASALSKAGFPNPADVMTNLYELQNAGSVEHMLEMFMVLNPGQQVEFAKKGLIARGVDAMIEVWINSILTSPVTHMVNIAGNTSFMMLRSLETAVASGIGKVRSGITGNADRVRAREALAQLEGIRASAFDSFLVAGKTAFTEEASDIASKIDVRERRAIGTTGDPRVVLQEIRNKKGVAAFVNTMGIVARMGGRALLAEDEFFKGIARRSQIYQLAEIDAANLYDELLAAGKTIDEAKAAYVERKAKILMDPPLDMVRSADEAARKLTFQGDMDGFLGDLQRAMSHPLIKLFVPFFKTPTNVMGETFARSPLALLHPKTLSQIKAGGREADMAMSRIATGSMVMGMMGWLSMGLYGEDNDVIITGAGPTDPRARAAWTSNLGFQPYSVNVRQEDGTYKSITYSRFDPVSGVLAMAADFAYYAQYEENPDVLDALATAATLSVSEYALQMPFLQGVQELGMAMMNPDPRVRSEQLQRLLTEKVGGAALTMVMPGTSSFSKGVGRLQDPTARQTMPEAGQIPFTETDITDAPAWMQGFYTALNKAKANNPWFNQDLPPRLNEWGEVMTVGTGAGWEFWSPVRIKNTTYSPVDEEMVYLGGGVSRTPQKISGVQLNSEQYNRWIELTNTLDAMGFPPEHSEYDVSLVLLPRLQDEIFSDQYQSYPTKEDKLNALNNIISTQRTIARDRMLSEYPELAEKVNAAQ